jgi:hypothetical protein
MDLTKYFHIHPHFSSYSDHDIDYAPDQNVRLLGQDLFFYLDHRALEPSWTLPEPLVLITEDYHEVMDYRPSQQFGKDPTWTMRRGGLPIMKLDLDSTQFDITDHFHVFNGVARNVLSELGTSTLAHIIRVTTQLGPSILEPNLYSYDLTPTKLSFASKASGLDFLEVKTWAELSITMSFNGGPSITIVDTDNFDHVWTEVAPNIFKAEHDNVTITYNRETEIFFVSAILANSARTYLLNKFKAIFPGTKTLVTTKTRGGIMSLEMMEKLAALLNMFIQILFDTKTEMVFLVEDDDAAEIMFRRVPNTKGEPLAGAARLNLPVHTLTRQVVIKIVNRINEIEAVPIRRRSNEMLREHITLVTEYTNFVKVAFLKCNICDTSRVDYRYMSKYLVCSKCANYNNL